jgi:hypothetical protein
LDYKDWETVANLILNSKHYDNIEYIQSIKNRMNNSRTIFDWKHLENLYKYQK